MILVKQKEVHECALACLVMVIGQDYEYVRSRLPDGARKSLDIGEGMFTDEMLLTLEEFDIVWDYSKEACVTDEDTYILTVPSKNAEGRLHSVVYHHGKVYDPSTRIQYTDPSEALQKTRGYLLCYKEFPD